MSEQTKFVTGFADIVEGDIPEEVLGLLLKDHTTGGIYCGARTVFAEFLGGGGGVVVTCGANRSRSL